MVIVILLPRSPPRGERDGPPATTPASDWGNLFQLKPGVWRCEVCRSTNPKEACTNCLSCRNAKPGNDAGVGKLTMKQCEPPMNAGVGSSGGGVFTFLTPCKHPSFSGGGSIPASKK